MSCYFRNLNNILAEAGIEITPQNRKQIDRTIHQIMAIEYKQCPVTWKKLKEQVLNNEAGRRDFIARLKKAV